MTAPPPPTPPPVPPPDPLSDPLPAGWTTPEFWTTVLVQVAALGAATVHVLLHRDVDLDAVDAALPVVAVLIAGLAHALYLRSRRQMHLTHLLTTLAHAGSDVEQIIALAKELRGSGSLATHH
ncbi:hypothetical protein [Pseudonocardia sp. TRM90224]|uniref:hypothetical protein n=1 Tax=Pseudonocardia sp. TRM90224 TaxID=2812678 RepID=UPI001E3A7177|nr:hypothetical protein [Pseudonocardia sp. TRM90224]